MSTRQVARIVISLAIVLALVGEPPFDFTDRTFASGGLLAAEALPERESAGQDAKESREFRAAIAAHHICSGLWVVGRSHKRTPEEVVAQDEEKESGDEEEVDPDDIEDEDEEI